MTQTLIGYARCSTDRQDLASKYEHAITPSMPSLSTGLVGQVLFCVFLFPRYML